MMQDKRYSGEDILAVIDFLKISGGKKFDINLTCKVRQNRKKHSEVKTTVDQDYAVGTNLQVSGVQR